jgi:Uma2 family endonuclease
MGEERAMATTKLFTIEDLEALPDDRHVYDLIDGGLRRREPVGAEHGIIGSGILSRLWTFVHEHDLGEMLRSETIYVYRRDPDRSLKPDVSFVRADRLPVGAEIQRPLTVPPDLAVEVVSPHDLAEEIDEKIALYRAFGVPLLWVFWPRRRAIAVYADGHLVCELEEGDELDGGKILPGFRVPVAELFRVGRKPSAS